MILNDTHFLARERQDHLLHEAACDRLARTIPRDKRPDVRARVAGVLIALALRIAPSVRVATQGPTFLLR